MVSRHEIGVLIQRLRHTVLNVEVLVGAFNQEKEACRGLLCDSENRSWNRWIVCSSRKWPLSTTAILSGPRMQLCIHGSWWEDFYKEVKRSKMSLFDICCWLLLPRAPSLITSQCSGLVRWNFQASDNATLCQEAQQVACYLVLLASAQS